MIVKQYEVGRFAVFCYLVGDEQAGEGLFIDPADRLVREGETIQVGSVGLRVIHTPGHSPGGMSLYVDGMVFTGDTLFVGSVGRTDFPGSSWEVMEASIRDKLYALPADTVVFPGHNYGASPTSTIRHERLHNPLVRG